MICLSLHKNKFLLSLPADEHLAVEAVPGSGKCLGKDTPVMLFDGTVRAVQDIVPGDLLMGPDSKPPHCFVYFRRVWKFVQNCTYQGRCVDM